MVPDDGTAEQVVDAMRDALLGVIRGHEAEALDLFMSIVERGPDADVAGQVREKFHGNEASAVDRLVAGLPAGMVFRFYRDVFAGGG